MFDKNILKNKKVCLTGGAGFIGHNLALKLKEIGANPYIIDGLQVNSLGGLLSGSSQTDNKDLYISFVNERIASLRSANVPMSILDIRDYHAVSQAISAFKPDCIIHLAAVAHANRSNKDPYSTYDHSLRTLENVLDNCRSMQTHIIYFSSSMVYGDFNDSIAMENQVCSPLGIYGALKFAAEKIIIGYHQVFGVPYTIIRPSALYGERCVSRRVGQAFIENAIHGKDLTLNGDGLDSLDFTYIQDLIQGVIKSICVDDAKNEIFNITYGQGRKLQDLAEIVLASFPGTKLIYKDRDALMPERGTLSIDKARDMLGYSPEYTLEKGLEQYIRWYKSLNLIG